MSCPFDIMIETLLCKAQIIDEIEKTAVDQELFGCGGGGGGAKMKETHGSRQENS